MTSSGRPWGSSEALRAVVVATAPSVQCFGHLHEQRGVWQRAASGAWIGGVEYEVSPGNPHPTWDAPPPPVGQLISCNAMQNHTGVDQQPKHVAGAPRLIVAVPVFDEDGGGQRMRPASGCWHASGEWRFVTDVRARMELESQNAQ